MHTEQKTKDVQGQGLSNVNLSLFVNVYEKTLQYYNFMYNQLKISLTQLEPFAIICSHIGMYLRLFNARVMIKEWIVLLQIFFF